MHCLWHSWMQTRMLHGKAIESDRTVVIHHDKVDTKTLEYVVWCIRLHGAALYENLKMYLV